MSTEDYLKGLDFEQLQYARDRAQALIDAKLEEERVVLLVLEGTCVNEACFKEEDFEVAKKALCAYIMTDEFTLEDVRYDHPLLVRTLVPESSVADLMSLNK